MEAALAEALIVPLLVAGTAVSSVSAIQQGRAAKKQGEAQAEIAARNAQMAEAQAEEQRVAAAAEAVRIEEQGEALKSRQRALFAKSGVDVGKGSPLSVLVDTASKTAADAAEIRRQGVISSITSQSQAGIMRAQGASAKAKGTAAGRASILSAVGTGMSGVAQAGLAHSQLNSPKAFKPTTSQKALFAKY